MKGEFGPFDDIGDPFGDAAAAPVQPLRPETAAELARPAPVRSRVRTLRVAALAAALLFDGAWVAWRRFRPDLAGEPPSAIALQLAIPLAAAALALGAGTLRGPRGLGLKASWITGLAVAAPALFVLATLVTTPPDAGDGRFWNHTVKCMLSTLVLAGVPFAFAVRAFRRAFVVAAGWRMAALGVACGGLAAATLSLTCPVGTTGHVLLGHGAILLVAALAGGALSRTLGRV